jgi:hypothetical protein
VPADPNIFLAAKLLIDHYDEGAALTWSGTLVVPQGHPTLGSVRSPVLTSAMASPVTTIRTNSGHTSRRLAPPAAASFRANHSVTKEGGG